jgi:peptidoglycan-associated lipoprotein
MLTVMREHLLIFALLALAGHAAEPPFDPAWPVDHQCFRSETVYFGSGRSTLSADAMQKIAEVVTYLKANPATALRIEGHCDHRGTTEHNLVLGDRRSQAVRTELLRRGIESDRIDAISFGKDRPADPGHGSAARKKNRRAEFVLLRPPVPEDPSAHNQTLHSTPR